MKKLAVLKVFCPQNRHENSPSDPSCFRNSDKIIVTKPNYINKPKLSYAFIGFKNAVRTPKMTAFRFACD
jgi:hypothetical protein